jgi:hypothetical protein
MGALPAVPVAAPPPGCPVPGLPVPGLPVVLVPASEHAMLTKQSAKPETNKLLNRCMASSNEQRARAKCESAGDA